jgi:hypothetical protein
VSRRLSGAAAGALALLAAAGAAAEEAPARPPPLAEYEDPLPGVGEAPGDSVDASELGVSLGMAIGARGVSPGGLRLAGHYLYQLSDLDWFDGGMAFTFGSGAAGCFRDRADELVCDHGRLDGVALDLFLGVRRFFPDNGGVRPWLRPALAARLVRFGDDDLTGVGLLAQAAGGIRARVADQVAIGGQLAFELGAAWLSRGHGPGLQAALSFGAVVEIALP